MFPSHEYPDFGFVVTPTAAGSIGVLDCICNRLAPLLTISNHNFRNTVSTNNILLFELLNETGGKLEDTDARNYITALPLGGKAAKLGKQILTLRPTAL